MKIKIHPLSQSFPGVTQEDFVVESHCHGWGHVNRVIILGQLLCEAVSFNNEPLLRALWASAFLHDLAREHDGDCTEHGRWAVQTKWPDYQSLFRKHGVHPTWDEVIKSAVTYHSLPQEMEPSHPHYALVALLKDADALDRVRLGGGRREVDPYYLRHNATHDFREFAYQLYLDSERTGTYDLPGLWALAQNLHELS